MLGIVCLELSAYVGGAFLRICLRGIRRLRWQLKHCCPLTFHKVCQENKAPVRKFERIVVVVRFLLVYLSEDCRRVR